MADGEPDPPHAGSAADPPHPRHARPAPDVKERYQGALRSLDRTRQPEQISALSALRRQRSDVRIVSGAPPFPYRHARTTAPIERGAGHLHAKIQRIVSAAANWL